MHLDYRLSEDWDENSSNLAAADETDLRYYAATGDVILRKDQNDLSARWGWIPLIDFALARGVDAAQRLQEQGLIEGAALFLQGRARVADIHHNGASFRHRAEITPEAPCSKYAAC